MVSSAEEIRKARQLLEDGVISKQQFEKMKNGLLGKNEPKKSGLRIKETPKPILIPGIVLVIIVMVRLCLVLSMLLPILLSQRDYPIGNPIVLLVLLIYFLDLVPGILAITWSGLTTRLNYRVCMAIFIIGALLFFCKSLFSINSFYLMLIGSGFYLETTLNLVIALLSTACFIIMALITRKEIEKHV